MEPGARRPVKRPVGATRGTAKLPFETHIGPSHSGGLFILVGTTRKAKWASRLSNNMDVYTGRGDDGNTDLRGGARVSKADPRIEAYGSIDELNALIGTIRPAPFDDIETYLDDIQQRLHVIQAELADPSGSGPPQIELDDVDRLEEWIDACDEALDPLESFILPGGGELGSTLHYARAVCRRAERRITALAEEEPVSEDLVVYVNRLSDVLFVLARLANTRDGIDEASPTY